MGRLSWLWWPRKKNKSSDEIGTLVRPASSARGFSAMAGGGALAVMSQPAAAQTQAICHLPKRALTGRDAAGKSVFKSFDVTPKVVEIGLQSGG